MKISVTVYQSRSMISPKMFAIQIFMVLICAIGVLTSSVTKTDGSLNETHLDNAQNLHSSEDVSTNSKSVIESDDNRPLKVMGEGGPIYQQGSPVNAPKSVPPDTIVSDGIQISTDHLIPLDSESKEPKIRNPSVVPRKGVVQPSKIAARKGVSLETSIQDVQTSTEDTRREKIESISSQTSTNTKKSTDEPKKLPDSPGVAKPAVDETSSSVQNVKNNSASSAKSSNVPPTTETNIVKATSTPPASTTRRFKPKPTVTIGEMNVDKPIPASPTKTPPLGMPRKIDYIVPVIITIMALPLLGGAAFFMYRRGRDCWDKRHYRRMDFLIDGMYNDHTSWK